MCLRPKHPQELPFNLPGCSVCLLYREGVGEKQSNCRRKDGELNEARMAEYWYSFELSVENPGLLLLFTFVYLEFSIIHTFKRKTCRKLERVFNKEVRAS